MKKPLTFTNLYSEVNSFSEIPPREGMPALTAEMGNKIMHVGLPVSKETVLMGSDIGGEWAPDFRLGNNFAVSINTDSRENADRFFNALAAGGKVTMPIDKTFWGDYFGMLEDKFGVNWMVSFGEQQ